MYENLNPLLAGALQEMGVPITSGYRSEAKNRAVGGARASQHLHGNAADIDMTGMSDAYRAAMVQFLRGNGVKRFGTYSNSPNMLHVDLSDAQGDFHQMHDRSGRNMAKAPKWFRDVAEMGDIAPAATPPGVTEIPLSDFAQLSPQAMAKTMTPVSANLPPGLPAAPAGTNNASPVSGGMPSAGVPSGLPAGGPAGPSLGSHMMAFGDMFQLPQYKTGAQQAVMAQQMGGPGATPKMGMATVKEGDEFLTYVTMDGVAVGQPLFRADRYKDAGVTVNTGDTPAPHPGDPNFMGYSDAGKGEYYIHDPNTGKLAIRTVPKEHRPTEGEAQRVVSMELAGQYLNNLKEARKRLQSKGTDISGVEGYIHAARQSKNPILQGMNEFAEKMGYPLDKDVAIAFTNANALRVDLLKAMRGVQVGYKEETMFETYVPTFGTPGATLDAVMGRLEMSLPYLTKRYDALRQLGVTDPSKATEAQKIEAARMAEPLRPAGYDSPLDTIDPYGAGTPPASPVPPPSGGADVSKWSVRTR